MPQTKVVFYKEDPTDRLNCVPSQRAHLSIPRRLSVLSPQFVDSGSNLFLRRVVYVLVKSEPRVNPSPTSEAILSLHPAGDS